MDFFTAMVLGAAVEVAVPGGSFTTNFWGGLRSDVPALLWLALLQVAFIVATWVISKVLVPRFELNSFAQYEVRPGASMGKAVQLYLAYAVLGGAALLALQLSSLRFKLLVLTALSSPEKLDLKWLGFFALVALVVFAVMLRIPIQIFQIRLDRTLGLLGLIAGVVLVSGIVLNVLLGHPLERRSRAIEEWAEERSRGQDLLEALKVVAQAELTFAAAEQAAMDGKRPTAERKEAIGRMYAQLEAIHEHLTEDDPEGRAEYEKMKDRYQAAFHRLRAELAPPSP